MMRQINAKNDEKLLMKVEVDRIKKDYEREKSQEDKDYLVGMAKNNRDSKFKLLNLAQKNEPLSSQEKEIAKAEMESLVLNCKIKVMGKMSDDKGKIENKINILKDNFKDIPQYQINVEEINQDRIKDFVENKGEVVIVKNADIQIDSNVKHEEKQKELELQKANEVNKIDKVVQEPVLSHPLA